MTVALAAPPEVDFDRTYTAEEFLALEDSVGYELCDGRLVKRAVSLLSSKTAVKIGFQLGLYLQSNPIGELADSSISLRLHPNRPNRLPRPDVAYFSFERLPADAPSTGSAQVPPDLIVEVVSENDNALKLEAKIFEYLDAGVRAVWVAYPDTHRIHVYTVDAIRVLGADEVIDGGDLLPGFACKVSNLVGS